MIGIEIDSLKDIEKDFYKNLSDYLMMDQKESKIDEWITEADNNGDSQLAAMFQYYKDNWERISKIDSLKALRKINNDFNLKFLVDIILWAIAKTGNSKGSSGSLKKDTSFGKFQAKMKNVYDDFMSEKIDGFENIGEWLATKLNIMTCPYCNRHYTFTILKGKSHPTLRPQFDHFLPKSKFPLTAVCFYNLVPTCPECNKMKGERILSIHPYDNSFERQGIVFRYDERSGKKNPIIEISKEDNENVKRLALKETYQKHADIVSDLINKAEAYNSSYYDSLVNSFSGLGMTQEEIDRAVWGISIDEKDIGMRPFSKLSRDILYQLGIVMK